MGRNDKPSGLFSATFGPVGGAAFALALVVCRWDCVESWSSSSRCQLAVPARTAAAAPVADMPCALGQAKGPNSARGPTGRGQAAKSEERVRAFRGSFFAERADTKKPSDLPSLTTNTDNVCIAT